MVILRNPWPRLLSEQQRAATHHHAVRYQLEGPDCRGVGAAVNRAVSRSTAAGPAAGGGGAGTHHAGAALAVEQEATPGIACNPANPGPHPEPLNCGQLLLNDIAFAEAVWSRRPRVFLNGEQSQQGYANEVKANFSHSGLPLDFFNHCWRTNRAASLHDICGALTYHATCALDSRAKLGLMSTVVQTAAGANCSLSQPHDLLHVRPSP